MTNVKISDVLHLAADKYLAEDSNYNWELKDEYSCNAVLMAIRDLCELRYYEYNNIRFIIEEGLENMGVNCFSGSEFSEFETFESSQAARYTWLKFAAMIAEEQGV